MAQDMIVQLTPGPTHRPACVYCGRPPAPGDHLVALRPSVRAAGRERQSFLDISDRALPALRMARCEPPCEIAERAYRDGFRD